MDVKVASVASKWLIAPLAGEVSAAEADAAFALSIAGSSTRARDSRSRFLRVSQTAVATLTAPNAASGWNDFTAVMEVRVPAPVSALKLVAGGAAAAALTLDFTTRDWECWHRIVWTRDSTARCARVFRDGVLTQVVSFDDAKNPLTLSLGGGAIALLPPAPNRASVDIRRFDVLPHRALPSDVVLSWGGVAGRTVQLVVPAGSHPAAAVEEPKPVPAASQVWSFKSSVQQTQNLPPDVIVCGAHVLNTSAMSTATVQAATGSLAARGSAKSGLAPVPFLALTEAAASLQFRTDLIIAGAATTPAAGAAPAIADEKKDISADFVKTYTLLLRFRVPAIGASDVLTIFETAGGIRVLINGSGQFGAFLKNGTGGWSTLDRLAARRRARKKAAATSSGGTGDDMEWINLAVLVRPGPNSVAAVEAAPAEINQRRATVTTTTSLAFAAAMQVLAVKDAPSADIAGLASGALAAPGATTEDKTEVLNSLSPTASETEAAAAAAAAREPERPFSAIMELIVNGIPIIWDSATTMEPDDDGAHPCPLAVVNRSSLVLFPGQSGAQPATSRLESALADGAAATGNTTTASRPDIHIQDVELHADVLSDADLTSWHRRLASGGALAAGANEYGPTSSSTAPHAKNEWILDFTNCTGNDPSGYDQLPIDVSVVTAGGAPGEYSFGCEQPITGNIQSDKLSKPIGHLILGKKSFLRLSHLHAVVPGNGKTKPALLKDDCKCVNNYTVVMTVRIPTPAAHLEWISILTPKAKPPEEPTPDAKETPPIEPNVAASFIHRSGTFGGQFIYAGNFQYGEWQRLVITVDSTLGDDPRTRQVSFYIDGVPVNATLVGSMTPDGIFALEDTIWMFDVDNDPGPIHVRDITVIGSVLSASTIGKLGPAVKIDFTAAMTAAENKSAHSGVYGAILKLVQPKPVFPKAVLELLAAKNAQLLADEEATDRKSGALSALSNLAASAASAVRANSTTTAVGVIEPVMRRRGPAQFSHNRMRFDFTIGEKLPAGINTMGRAVNPEYTKWKIQSEKEKLNAPASPAAAPVTPAAPASPLSASAAAALITKETTLSDPLPAGAPTRWLPAPPKILSMIDPVTGNRFLQCESGTYLRIPAFSKIIPSQGDGGMYVNHYSISMEIKIPVLPDRFAIVQSALDSNTNDADSYIQQNGTFGWNKISGLHNPAARFTANAWHHLCITHNPTREEYTFYLNGAVAYTFIGGQVDWNGRFGIDPTATSFFTSQDELGRGAAMGGFGIRKLEICGYVLTPEEIRHASGAGGSPVVSIPAALSPATPSALDIKHNSVVAANDNSAPCVSVSFADRALSGDIKLVPFVAPPAAADEKGAIAVTPVVAAPAPTFAVEDGITHLVVPPAVGLQLSGLVKSSVVMETYSVVMDVRVPPRASAADVFAVLRAGSGVGSNPNLPSACIDALSQIGVHPDTAIAGSHARGFVPINRWIRVAFTVDPYHNLPPYQFSMFVNGQLEFGCACATKTAHSEVVLDNWSFVERRRRLAIGGGDEKGSGGGLLELFTSNRVNEMPGCCIRRVDVYPRVLSATQIAALGSPAGPLPALPTLAPAPALPFMHRRTNRPEAALSLSERLLADLIDSGRQQKLNSVPELRMAELETALRQFFAQPFKVGGNPAGELTPVNTVHFTTGMGDRTQLQLICDLLIQHARAYPGAVSTLEVMEYEDRARLTVVIDFIRTCRAVKTLKIPLTCRTTACDANALASVIAAPYSSITDLEVLFDATITGSNESGMAGAVYDPSKGDAAQTVAANNGGAPEPPSPAPLLLNPAEFPLFLHAVAHSQTLKSLKLDIVGGEYSLWRQRAGGVWYNAVCQSVEPLHAAIMANTSLTRVDVTGLPPPPVGGAVHARMYKLQHAVLRVTGGLDFPPTLQTVELLLSNRSQFTPVAAAFAAASAQAIENVHIRLPPVLDTAVGSLYDVIKSLCGLKRLRTLSITVNEADAPHSGVDYFLGSPIAIADALFCVRVIDQSESASLRAVELPLVFHADVFRALSEALRARAKLPHAASLTELRCANYLIPSEDIRRKKRDSPPSVVAVAADKWNAVQLVVDALQEYHNFTVFEFVTRANYSHRASAYRYALTKLDEKSCAVADHVLSGMAAFVKDSPNLQSFEFGPVMIHDSTKPNPLLEVINENRTLTNLRFHAVSTVSRSLAAFAHNLATILSSPVHTLRTVGFDVTFCGDIRSHAAEIATALVPTLLSLPPARRLSTVACGGEDPVALTPFYVTPTDLVGGDVVTYYPRFWNAGYGWNAVDQAIATLLMQARLMSSNLNELWRLVRLPKPPLAVTANSCILIDPRVRHVMPVNSPIFSVTVKPPELLSASLDEFSFLKKELSARGALRSEPHIYYSLASSVLAQHAGLKKLVLEIDELTEHAVEFIKTSKTIKRLSLMPIQTPLRATPAAASYGAVKPFGAPHSIVPSSTSIAAGFLPGLFQILKVNRSITSLTIDYSGDAITDSVAVAIADALADNHVLTRLSLRGNAISATGATALTGLLSTHEKLKFINLGMNRLDAPAIMYQSEVNRRMNLMSPIFKKPNRFGVDADGDGDDDDTKKFIPAWARKSNIYNQPVTNEPVIQDRIQLGVAQSDDFISQRTLMLVSPEAEAQPLDWLETIVLVFVLLLGWVIYVAVAPSMICQSLLETLNAKWKKSSRCGTAAGPAEAGSGPGAGGGSAPAADAPAAEETPYFSAVRWTGVAGTGLVGAYRWYIMIGCFLLLSSFLWYPFVMAYFVLDAFSEANAALVGIGIYFICIFLFLVGILTLTSVDESLRSVERPTPRITNFNTVPHLIVFVSMALDAYQLCSISFVPNLYPSDSGSRAFEPALLGFSISADAATKAAFWVIVIIALIWITLAAFLQGVARAERPNEDEDVEEAEPAGALAAHAQPPAATNGAAAASPTNAVTVTISPKSDEKSPVSPASSVASPTSLTAAAAPELIRPGSLIPAPTPAAPSAATAPVSRSSLSDLGVIPKIDFIVTLLSNTLFFTIVTNLMKWVACQYPEDGVTPAYLEAYPTVACWAGDHRWYAAVAMVVLLVYIMSANWIGVFFLENPDPTIEIKITEAFIILDRTMKLFIAAAITFGGSGSLTGLIITLLTVSLLLATVIVHRPCRDIVLINVLRVMVYSASIWSCASSLYAYTVSDPLTNYGPTIMLFVGWGVIIPGCIFGYGYREEIIWFTRGTALAPLGEWLSDIERTPCKYCSRQIVSSEIHKHMETHAEALNTAAHAANMLVSSQPKSIDALRASMNLPPLSSLIELKETTDDPANSIPALPKKKSVNHYHLKPHMANVVEHRLHREQREQAAKQQEKHVHDTVLNAVGLAAAAIGGGGGGGGAASPRSVDKIEIELTDIKK